jgi:pimeloyl-ACP methyl ester carboxylesterase
MQTGHIEANGHNLEYQLIPAHQVNRPTLVFLHEGLGSVAMWRDFPARVAAATGCRTLVYSRYGYGQSDVLEAPFGVRYMHEEALQTLPALLFKLGIDNPVLIGHSDGGSIALIHAGGASRPVAGLILMAPHVFVEDLSVASIAQAKVSFETTDLPKRLAKYHCDAVRTFWGWNDIWLHPDFRAWNIEEYLPRIACPVLAIQGLDDEYGTLAQIEAIRRQVKGEVDVLELADCRHSPHKDQPEATLAAMVSFISVLEFAA